MTEVNVQFGFERFFITKSLVEYGQGAQNFKDLELGFAPSAEFFKKSGLFRLHLVVKVEDKPSGLFIEVNCTSDFRFDAGALQDNKLPDYFYVNAPAIAYPYVRSYISALSNLSGCGTITLPVMNLSNLRDAWKENTKVIDE